MCKGNLEKTFFIGSLNLLSWLYSCRNDKFLVEMLLFCQVSRYLRDRPIYFEFILVVSEISQASK